MGDVIDDVKFIEQTCKTKRSVFINKRCIRGATTSYHVQQLITRKKKKARHDESKTCLQLQHSRVMHSKVL